MKLGGLILASLNVLAQSASPAKPAAPVVPDSVQAAYFKALAQFNGLKSAMTDARDAVLAAKAQADAACGQAYSLDETAFQNGTFKCIAKASEPAKPALGNSPAGAKK